MNTVILNFASFTLGFCHLQKELHQWKRRVRGRMGIMRVCEAPYYTICIKISNKLNFVNLGTHGGGGGWGQDLVRVNSYKRRQK